MQEPFQEKRSMPKSGIIGNACKRNIDLYSKYKSDIYRTKNRGGPRCKSAAKRIWHSCQVHPSNEPLYRSIIRMTANLPFYQSCPQMIS